MNTDDHKLLYLIRQEIKEGIEGFRQDVRNGFQETNDRLDQTNARLDQTNVRLEAAITMTRDFRKDVSQKLDQIGGYLGSIDGEVLKHEERIQSLETRVERLEQTG